MLLIIVVPEAGNKSVFDIGRLAQFATVFVDEYGERLRLCDGSNSIAVRVVEGSLLSGTPVGLRFLIDDARAAQQMRTLAQFRSLRDLGRFGNWMHRPEVRARRWIMQLRSFDAVNAGASEREIADELFGSERTTAEWRDRDGSLRSVVRRLLSAGRANVVDGYRDLLR